MILKWIVLAVLWTVVVILTCKRLFTPPVKGFIIVTYDKTDNTTYFFLEPLNKEALEKELSEGKYDYITFRIKR